MQAGNPDSGGVCYLLVYGDTFHTSVSRQPFGVFTAHPHSLLAMVAARLCVTVQASPLRMAHTAACVRPVTPILRRMFWTCSLMVS